MNDLKFAFRPVTEEPRLHHRGLATVRHYGLLVIRQAMALTGLGVAFGLAASLALTRDMGS